MKYLVCLLMILSSCNLGESHKDLNNQLSISGFNRTLWQFDSLSCYPHYRRQQAYIIKSNKGKFIDCKVADIEKILGRPFKVEQSAKLFSYNYLISNEYCCDSIDQVKRDRIELYGIGAANLSVSFNMNDSMFYDVIIGTP